MIAIIRIITAITLFGLSLISLGICVWAVASDWDTGDYIESSRKKNASINGSK